MSHGKKKKEMDSCNGHHSVPVMEQNFHWQFSLPLWVVTVTKQTYRDTLPLVMATEEGITMSDIPNRCEDDVLHQSDSLQENFLPAVSGWNGNTLSLDKFVFCKEVVVFVGCDRVRPCQNFFQAIFEFPAPKSPTDARSWFDQVKRVPYAFSMASRSLRKLLKQGHRLNKMTSSKHFLEN